MSRRERGGRPEGEVRGSCNPSYPFRQLSHSNICVRYSEGEANRSRDPSYPPRAAAGEYSNMEREGRHITHGPKPSTPSHLPQARASKRSHMERFCTVESSNAVERSSTVERFGARVLESLCMC